jgi:hypothetical protein
MRSAAVRCAPVVALLLVGCSDLQVYELSPDDNAPLVGAMSYYLPRSAITFSGTVALNSCTMEPTAKGPQINFDATASVTPVVSTEPDPDYHYYISYEKSRSWMKEINFSVTNNASGTLQSVNNTINDQAGPDIVAAIGAAVQIGGAVTLGGVAAPAETAHTTSTAKDDTPTCSTLLTAEVYKAVQNLAKDKEDKKKITDSPATGAAEAAAQAQAVQAIQTEIDKETKTLTRSFTYKWIPSRRDASADDGQYELIAKRIPIEPIVKQWFTPRDKKHGNGQGWLEQHGLSGADARSKLTSPYLATLAVLKSSMDGPMAWEILDGSHAPVRQVSDGLTIRDPATATLRICRGTDPGCLPSAAVTADNRLVDTTTDKTPRMALRIPQFGRVVILPEKSGLFENANLTASLNPDGTISTISFHATSTLATAIGGIGTAAANAGSAITARNTAIAAQNTAAAAVTTATTAQVQAPDTYNKALADCLSQAATIVKAGGKPVPCQ